MSIEDGLSLITEVCPDCGHENKIEWSIVDNGYQVLCSNCGFPMMLCSECMCNNEYCDWNSDTFMCYRMVEGFWKNLSDVPFKEDETGRLLLEKGYRLMGGNREVMIFSAGTEREVIWRWFDKHHPKGVAYLLYGEETPVDENGTKNEK